MCRATGEERHQPESATLNVTDEMMPPACRGHPGRQRGRYAPFTLSYPEDFDNEDLAGKTVAFRSDGQDRAPDQPAPIDDELAKMVGD